MSARQAVPGDFDFDPTYRRQRQIARYVLGIAINRYPQKPEPGLYERQRPATRQELIDLVIKEGLCEFDDYHHAPMCPSNNWGRMHLPEGACNCGAERHKIMSRR